MALLPLCTALAGGPKMAPDLAGQYFRAGSRVPIIVQFRASAGGEAHRRILASGGVVRARLQSIHANAYTVPGEQLARLADDPDVEFIAPDRPLAATSFSASPDYGWMTVTGLNSIGGALPYDGTGIGIAVIDSGINDRPDLHRAAGLPGPGNRIIFNQSFVPGDNGVNDAFGHGTHVAGILAGNGSASSAAGPGPVATYTIRGIAPNANLINLRALDSNGQAVDSTVIAAIQRAIQLQKSYNIRVINLSLGRGVFSSYQSDPLCQAVEQAWQAGIVVVVSAGNEGRNNSANTNGYGTITAPGNDPRVITVGAVNTEGTASRSDDKVTSYSSKGPSLFDMVIKPDIVAPGNRVLSLVSPGSSLVKSYPDNQVPKYVYESNGGQAAPDYYELSGTSMAAPMVSGAAAVLLQKNGTLTPDQVKAILMRTAAKFPQTTSVAVDPQTGIPYTSTYDIFTIGAGYVDLNAALANTDVPQGSAISPAASYDATSGSFYLTTSGNTLWDTNTIWAARAVWGISVVWGTTIGGQCRSVVWGTGLAGEFRSVVWGTSVTGEFRSVVWGTGNTTSSEAAGIAIEGEN